MARLTKQQLADRDRYKWETDEVEIPELDGTVEVRTLSVEERDDLPELVTMVVGPKGDPVTDNEGNLVMKPDASIDDLAQVWAAVVSDPKLTVEEVKEFVGGLPATALDRIIVKFGQLLSSDTKAKASQNGKADEEGADIRRDFRPVADRS